MNPILLEWNLTKNLFLKIKTLCKLWDFHKRYRSAKRNTENGKRTKKWHIQAKQKVNKMAKSMEAPSLHN